MVLGMCGLPNRRRVLVNTVGEQSERRAHPRGAIELEVAYKRVNSFFHDYTQNISRGGTFIKTPKPLAIGTEFIFKLVVPLLPRPLRLRGVVRWIVGEDQRSKDKPDPGMGIEFIYADDEDRGRVQEAVEDLMAQQLGERTVPPVAGQVNIACGSRRPMP